MKYHHLNAVPNQSLKAYKVLSTLDSATAQQLAEKLGILPNTVYRNLQPLIELGVVEKSTTYPVVYRSVPSAVALEWYMRAALQSFRSDFGVTNTPAINDTLPSMTFIKDKTGLRNITELEAQKTQRTINAILSGHRVAESTIAVYRKAVVHGVTFRVIIENDPNSPEVDHEAFRLMNAEVRYLPNIGIRLFTFDSRAAVLTSYDPVTPNRAFGIRFTYASVAEQLDELFEQRWLQATPVLDDTNSFVNTVKATG